LNPESIISLPSETGLFPIPTSLSIAGETRDGGPRREKKTEAVMFARIDKRAKTKI